MKINNFEDKVLNKDHSRVSYPSLKKQYNAYLYTLDFDPDITRFDDEVINDDYDKMKYHTRMWRDIYPQ